MRLMLGTNDNPSLLVDIQQEFSPTHFEFWVVNGCWEGTYTNGHVTIWHPDNPWSDLNKTEILCDNQDRLRTTGEWGAYQEVFDNFHNHDYVAPKPEKVVLPSNWDDDIPF
jgi:hypothetical protein